MITATRATLRCLVGVGKTTHTTHHAEHVVVGTVDTYLGSTGTLTGSVGEHELKIKYSVAGNEGEIGAKRELTEDRKCIAYPPEIK